MYYDSNNGFCVLSLSNQCVVDVFMHGSASADDLVAPGISLPRLHEGACMRMRVCCFVYVRVYACVRACVPNKCSVFLASSACSQLQL